MTSVARKLTATNSPKAGAIRSLLWGNEGGMGKRQPKRMVKNSGGGEPVGQNDGAQARMLQRSHHLCRAGPERVCQPDQGWWRAPARPRRAAP